MTTPDIEERLTRLERIVSVVAASVLGGGAGPLDPNWRQVRARVRADVAAIQAEAVEAPMERRAG